MECRKCKKQLEDSEAYEYRGAISCEKHFDEVIKDRDFERQEVIKTTEASVKSQIGGQWFNGGYKTMKTDPHSGKPIGKVKEPLTLQDYENPT